MNRAELTEKAILFCLSRNWNEPQECGKDIADFALPLLLAYGEEREADDAAYEMGKIMGQRAAYAKAAEMAREVSADWGSSVPDFKPDPFAQGLGYGLEMVAKKLDALASAPPQATPIEDRLAKDGPALRPSQAGQDDKPGTVPQEIPKASGLDPAGDAPSQALHADAETRVRVKQGWEHAGREGVRLALVEVEQPWAVVKWDDEDDPDCHKAAGLEEITAPQGDGDAPASPSLERARSSDLAGDVFERVAREWYGTANSDQRAKGLASLLRERFGPVVQLVNEASQGFTINRDEARREYDRLAGQPARASEQALLRLGEQSSPSPERAEGER